MTKTNQSMLISDYRPHCNEQALTFQDDVEKTWTLPFENYEWLDRYCLKAQGLTNDDFLFMVKECGRFRSGQNAYTMSAILEFDDRLHTFMLNVALRIQWMLQVKI